MEGKNWLSHWLPSGFHMHVYPCLPDSQINAKIWKRYLAVLLKLLLNQKQYHLKMKLLDPSNSEQIRNLLISKFRSVQNFLKLVYLFCSWSVAKQWALYYYISLWCNSWLRKADMRNLSIKSPLMITHILQKHQAFSYAFSKGAQQVAMFAFPTCTCVIGVKSTAPPTLGTLTDGLHPCSSS